MSRIALRDALRALSASPLALAALLVTSGSAWAFVPPEDQPSFTVAVPMLERNRTSALRTAPATRDEEAKVAASLPGVWEVRWNRLTNTPHRVSGRGLDLAPGGFSADTQVDRVARQFVDEHAELLGVRSADLALVAVTHAARHWSAIYEQTVGGIPIEGSRVDFLFSESGRLLSFGSDAYRKVSALGGLALAADQALGAGGAGLPAPVPAAAPVLRILPIPAELPGHEELQVVFHLAYRMELVTSEPRGRWLTWVDAGTGALLWRYDLIRYLEITGTSTGSIEDFGYCDGAQNEPLKDLTVNVSGVASVFTNAAGQYSATVPDNSLRTVTAQLRGRRVRIQNNAGANASFSGQTTPGNPLAITWAAAQPDERDVYVHTTRSYDFMRVIDPTTPLGALDTQLSTPEWRDADIPELRRENPDYARVQVRQGLVLASTNRLQAAQAYLEDLNERAPANQDIRNSRNIVYLLRGWPRRAAADYEWMLAGEPDYAWAHAGLFDSGMAMRDYPQAERALAQLTAHLPGEVATRKRAADWATHNKRELRLEVTYRQVGGRCAGSRSLPPRATCCSTCSSTRRRLRTTGGFTDGFTTAARTTSPRNPAAPREGAASSIAPATGAPGPS